MNRILLSDFTPFTLPPIDRQLPETVEQFQALPTCGHDPAIIACNDDDQVYPLCGELLEILDIRRNVTGLTSLMNWLEIDHLASHKIYLTGVKAPGTDTMTTFFPANSLDAS